MPEQFTDNQVEAMISGLLLGTYDLGHFKANKKVHPFIEPDFTLHLVSDKDHLAVAKKGIKIAKAQLAILNLVDLPSNTVNPKYVLRNYMAQLCIDEADKGDYSLLKELFEMLKKPYDEQLNLQKWFAKRPDWARDKVGCSMLSCSS